MGESKLDTIDEPSEIVSFMVRGLAFCLAIEHVLEIRGWTDTTALPHSPDYVLGMMNLRGTVLPVIDLSQRFGFGRTVPEARHVIIIVSVHKKITGFLVDSVSDIAMVHESEMQPTPMVSSDKTSLYIKGVYTIDGTLIRAIDAVDVMAGKEMEDNLM